MKSSTAFSTIYHPLPVKVNTPLPFRVSCAGSFYVHASKPPALLGGIRNFSTKLSENKLNVHEEFLFWFSGFTDGEGNFSISFDRSYIRFRFKINLHIDDLLVLKFIRSKLNIGTIIIEENRNSCAFVVQKFSDIKDVLCPIFINFPLHTSKKLDFQDFSA